MPGSKPVKHGIEFRRPLLLHRRARRPNLEPDRADKQCCASAGSNTSHPVSSQDNLELQT